MPLRMPQPSRKLKAQRLFARVTASLEDALEIAVAGQSPCLKQKQLVTCARRLQGSLRETLALVGCLAAAKKSSNARVLPKHK